MQALSKSGIFLSTNTFFDKMKAHLWKYSKIDLNRNYLAIKNRVLVIAQIKS